MRANDQLPDWARRFYGKRMGSLRDVFPNPKPIIGMVHLRPLPGAPAYEGEPMDAIIEEAKKDATYRKMVEEREARDRNPKSSRDKGKPRSRHGRR